MAHQRRRLASARLLLARRLGRLPGPPDPVSPHTHHKLGRAVSSTKGAEILEAAVRSGASDIRVLGSIARGDAHDESDIDFLVEFEKGVAHSTRWV
ncbi:MAG: nucleotidyltransferase family protein [Actinomycetota bacterium]